MSNIGSNNLELDQSSQKTGSDDNYYCAVYNHAGSDTKQASLVTLALQSQHIAKTKRRLRALDVGAVLLLLGILTYVFGFMKGTATTETAPMPVASSNPGVIVKAAIAATTPTLTVAQIAQNVTPATVKIINQQLPTVSSTDPYPADSASPLDAIPLPVDIGTGIIYEKAGYILTNNHVVSGATSLLVRLPDGRSYPATLVGGDPQTDLAVIKINPNGDTLPVAILGDASALQIGERVVAIGNAINLRGGPSVAEGIVSGLNRSILEPTSGPHPSNPTTQLYGLIQTDAAINPGNSGGPLINTHGQVIGINTLIDGTRIGFAISINQARAIAQQLVANGTLIHASMGISTQNLTPALASNLKVNTTRGAVVVQVQPGLFGAAAILKANDVIVSIDGINLDFDTAYELIISQYKAGDQVSLQVITPISSGGSGMARSVNVTLGTHP